MPEIELLKPYKNIQAVFSTRAGGVSRGAFSSLNLAFHVGDSEADVLANRELLKSSFGENVTLHAMQQVHGSEVCHVDAAILQPTCDALITDTPGQLLIVMVADCIPILFYDPVHKAVAAAHAGRSGAFGNIAANTVKRLNDAFGTKAADLLVVLGPSIHSCCYEVGGEIALEANSLGLGYALRSTGWQHFLDIQSIVTKQLIDLGVGAAHIEISDICTACESESFFSYRKEGKTGRFCGGIMLK